MALVIAENVVIESFVIHALKIFNLPIKWNAAYFARPMWPLEKI